LTPRNIHSKTPIFTTRKFPEITMEILLGANVEFTRNFSHWIIILVIFFLGIWIGLDWIVSGQWWSSTPARGPQDEPNVHHVLSLMFASTYLLFWLMRVKLNRPPKPEESQKNSSFNGKPIPYPSWTRNLWVSTW
jgi:hypothetical protein